ncbi:hypothetical protein DIPPA_20410 [Diplonema papillatum]|nr:hypothetical protein DIPPA_20410 [Diplonema papillatum]
MRRICGGPFHTVDELRAFVAATRPSAIIPTVGSEDTRRQARQTLLKPVQSSLRPWDSSKRRKTESERDVLVIVDDEPVIDLTASPPRPS